MILNNTGIRQKQGRHYLPCTMSLKKYHSLFLNYLNLHSTIFILLWNIFDSQKNNNVYSHPDGHHSAFSHLIFCLLEIKMAERINKCSFLLILCVISVLFEIITLLKLLCLVFIHMSITSIFVSRNNEIFMLIVLPLKS